MPAKDPTKQPVALIKSSFSTLIHHPVILFPFALIAFVQLFVLELIFFSTRYPLNVFFGPLIKKLFGPIYLQYPFNFFLLNKWFQVLQPGIYVLINSFFIGAAVWIIHLINSDKAVKNKAVFGRAFARFAHLIVSAMMAAGTLFFLSFLYGFLVRRAFAIRSTAGVFFWIKQTVLLGAPYMNLLFAVVVTALFAFLIPIVMIDKKNIFKAVGANFKLLRKNFFFVFCVIFLVYLLYVPVLIIRANTLLLQEKLVPEVGGWLIVVSVLVSLFIDALQYTAITVFYLTQKEMK